MISARADVAFAGTKMVFAGAEAIFARAETTFARAKMTFSGAEMSFNLLKTSKKPPFDCFDAKRLNLSHESKHRKRKK